MTLDNGKAAATVADVGEVAAHDTDAATTPAATVADMAVVDDVAANEECRLCAHRRNTRQASRDQGEKDR